MRYKLLGTSGLRVSELCLGTMTFGEAWGWGASRDESRHIFEAFVEAGGIFFDTANIYTEGESEQFLGEFIASERERFVVTTKYTCSRGQDDPNAAGNHRKNMIQSLEASLKRLRTEYIDLYLGRELIDRALIAHVANEVRLLQPLSREEQHTLAVLLRTWLASLEHHS